MESERSLALLDFLLRCDPQDKEFRHEYRLQSILLSPSYRKLAADPVFKTKFRQNFSEEFLRTCTEKQLQEIPSRLKKEQKIQSLMASNDYQTLAQREIFQDWFEDLFSEQKLRAYPDEKLDELFSVLPLVDTCLDAILFSLNNGAGSELTPNDMPIFDDRDDLICLIQRLSDSNGKNYCNIKPEEFIALFDEATVKTICEIFDELPADCKDFGSAIKEALPGKKYCISENEVKEYEKAYESEIAATKKEISAYRNTNGKRQVKKAVTGVICLFIPVLFASVTNLLSAGILPFCMAGEFALTALFWKKG